MVLDGGRGGRQRVFPQDSNNNRLFYGTVKKNDFRLIVNKPSELLLTQCPLKNDPFRD